jgi:uncharacterized integral membrane protein
MPGRKRMFIGVVIVAMIVIFIVQNSGTTNLYLFWWVMDIPVAVVVAVPFLGGMLAGGLFAWREQRKEIRNQQLHGSPALAALAGTAKKRQTKWWW